MPPDGPLLADALALLVGESLSWLAGGEPGWREVLDDYTNSQIADALAIPKGPRNSRAWTERRDFFRGLQRYRKYADDLPGQRRNPERSPGAVERLEDAGTILRERDATPPDLAGVLRLIRRHGLTVAWISGWARISEDVSYRTVADVFCGPGALSSAGFHGAAEGAGQTGGVTEWDRALDLLLEVWADSYGVAEWEWTEVDELAVQVGRQVGAEMGGHRVAGPHRVAP